MPRPRLLPDALTPAAVKALHRACTAALDARLDAIPGTAEDAEKREALRRLLITGAQNGRTIGDKQLGLMARLPLEQVERARREIRRVLPARAQAAARAAGRERSLDARQDRLFGRASRIYVPLQVAGGNTVETMVAAALAPHGYRLADYAGNKATDAEGKQSFRIGKLLGRHAPQLRDAYEQDPSRMRAHQLLCLSRDPVDIARMSTGRGWHSCMAHGDMNYDHIPAEIKGGTLVAYLVETTDPDVMAPLARILLKPYVDREGNRIYLPAKSYGLHNADFSATAAAIAERLSEGAPEGRYAMVRGIYKDDMNGGHLRLNGPVTAERFLTLLDVPFTAYKNGRIHVPGDLSMMDLGLTALPDLRHVTVTGDFRCDINKLTSLANMPRQVGRHISARFNKLESLEGLPQTVRGDVDVSFNALTDLRGAPAKVPGRFNFGSNAVTGLAYCPQEVGFDFLCRSNPLTSLQGGPVKVGGAYDCSLTGITSLQGVPSKVNGDFSCRGNGLRDLRFLPQGVKHLNATKNPLVTLGGIYSGMRTIASELGTFNRFEQVPEALRAYAPPGLATAMPPRRQPAPVL